MEGTATFDSVFDSAMADVSSGGDEEVVVDSGNETSTDKADVEVIDDDAPDSTETADETVTEETTEETESDDETEVTEAPEAKVEQPKAAEEADPDVPEGATVETDKKGNKFFRFDAVRGKQIYAGYKQHQAFQAALAMDQRQITEAANSGDQIAITVRDAKYLDDMDRKMALGQREQEQVLGYFLSSSAGAFDAGAVSDHPHQYTADAILTVAKTKAPMVYEALQAKLGNEAKSAVIEEIYSKAKAAGLTTKEGLAFLGTAQRIEEHVFNKYRKADEVLRGAPAPDPQEAMSRELNALKAEKEERARTEQAQIFDNWLNDARSDRRAETEKILSETLAPVEQAYGKLSGPLKEQAAEHLKTLRIRLERELIDSLQQDPNWASERDRIIEQARIARVEQFRNAGRTQLLQRYAVLARSIMAAKAKSIIDAQTALITEASARANQRLAKSQNQRPAGQQGAPPKVAIATPDKSAGKLRSIDETNRLIDKLFGAA